MNEVTFVFCLFQFTGQQDRRSFGVDLHCVRKRLGFRESENLFQHFDDVVVGVVVVVQQDDVIQRLKLIGSFVFYFG